MPIRTGRGASCMQPLIPGDTCSFPDRNCNIVFRLFRQVISARSRISPGSRLWTAAGAPSSAVYSGYEATGRSPRGRGAEPSRYFRGRQPPLLHLSLREQRTWIAPIHNENRSTYQVQNRIQALNRRRGAQRGRRRSSCWGCGGGSPHFCTFPFGNSGLGFRLSITRIAVQNRYKTGSRL